MLLKHALSQVLFHHDLEEDLAANLDDGILLEIVVIISSAAGPGHLLWAGRGEPFNPLNSSVRANFHFVVV